MNRPSLLEGVGVAFLASVVFAVMYGAVTGWPAGIRQVLPLSPGEQLIGLVAAAGLANILYLVMRSSVRVGRISTVLLWAIITAACALMGATVFEMIAIQFGLIWLTRSLYFYKSLLSALADALLSAFSLLAGIAAFVHTGSVFLTVWSVLLVQAMFVLIPADLRRVGPRATQTNAPTADNQRFDKAHRTAQAALNRIASTS